MKEPDLVILCFAEPEEAFFFFFWQVYNGFWHLQEGTLSNNKQKECTHGNFVDLWFHQQGSSV